MKIVPKKESTSLTPQPLAYPACGTCKTPFVLRRMVFVFTSNGKPDRPEWLFQRDCKHKTAEIITVDERPKARTRRTGAAR